MKKQEQSQQRPKTSTANEWELWEYRKLMAAKGLCFVTRSMLRGTAYSFEPKSLYIREVGEDFFNGESMPRYEHV